MNYNILLLLLIGHFIGDFYLQSDKVANNKYGCKIHLIKHCVLYAISMIVVILPVFNVDILIIALIISFIHLVVDFAKTIFKNKEKNRVVIYILDQIIHLFVIFCFAILISSKYKLSYITFVQYLLDLFEVNDLKLLALTLSLLIILKPASISMKIVLSKYSGFTKEEREGVPNTGSLIGQIERLVIFLMLLQGQYAAIGFILTAKSVARYKRIVEEARFSEYYLLGTLLSTLIVISVYTIITAPFL